MRTFLVVSMESRGDGTEAYTIDVELGLDLAAGKPQLTNVSIAAALLVIAAYSFIDDDDPLREQLAGLWDAAGQAVTKVGRGKGALAFFPLGANPSDDDKGIVGRVEPNGDILITVYNLDPSPTEFLAAAESIMRTARTRYPDARDFDWAAALQEIAVDLGSEDGEPSGLETETLH